MTRETNVEERQLDRPMLDEVMSEMQVRGSKQRRNWWDVLAGGVDGKPITVYGREFPVLKVAQRRQRKKNTPNAISRNAREEPPGFVKTARWPGKRRRKLKPKKRKR